MALRDYYNWTATRKTATSASDSMGGQTLTWSGTTTIKGRLVNLSADELILNEQMKTDIRFYFYCDSSNTILVTDRLLIGSTTYEVKAVQTFQDKTINHHIRVGLKVVT